MNALLDTDSIYEIDDPYILRKKLIQSQQVCQQEAAKYEERLLLYGLLVALIAGPILIAVLMPSDLLPELRRWLSGTAILIVTAASVTMTAVALYLRLLVARQKRYDVEELSAVQLKMIEAQFRTYR